MPTMVASSVNTSQVQLVENVRTSPLPVLNWYHLVRSTIVLRFTLIIYYVIVTLNEFYRDVIVTLYDVDGDQTKQHSV